MTSVERLQPRTTSLVFQCFVQTERLRDFAQVMLDLWIAEQLPPIESALIGPLNIHQPIAPSDVVPHLAEGPDDMHANNRWAEMMADGHINCGIALHKGTTQAFCSFNMRLVTMAHKDVGAARAFQMLCVAFCKSVMQAFPVYAADLRPVAEGLSCFPEPPLVEGSSHIVVTSVDEISDYYDKPSDFLAAGWDLAAEHN